MVKVRYNKVPSQESAVARSREQTDLAPATYFCTKMKTLPFPVLKKFKAALVTSGPIICLQWLKNFPPSGPGALSALKDLTAS
ncbi:unnamed protein product [Dovyalis caffra]|uniref:Uncharacterized protein n=1 Tax=Dovyalis caffra TaxID=77055 RepID=A0AAV1R818_9ROSI|nr:unnamed protein product [Dovyalis caffra]CAK7328629.1 unnamed protein product [Dovyalis caffra]